MAAQKQPGVPPAQHTVQNGDMLFDIAQAYYGDGNQWQRISAANGNIRAESLTIGQKLTIPQEGTPSVPSGGDIAQKALDAHNKYRGEVGVAPLQWSNNLAASAQRWADHLAQTGEFKHSQSGENLAKGGSSDFSVTRLVDMWGDEKQHFHNGAFPDISNTGNWTHAGHYSQIVWRNTTEVGCGLAHGNGETVLVCHYNPVGNFHGQNAF